MKFGRISLWQWVTALLSVVALVLCCIMTAHGIGAAGLIGCVAGSSCDAVLGSRWSMLAGVVPVSGLAVGVWLAMLVCLSCSVLLREKDAETAELAGKLMVLLAGIILGSAVWFISVQVFIIHKFCPYCMAAHGAGIIVSVIVLVHGRRHGKIWLRLFIAGLSLAVALAVVQLATTPRSSFAKGVADEALPEIPAGSVPILGSEDAPYTVTLLFDYQCSHCRNIHTLLDEVVAKSDGQIAFRLCPTPLSVHCNRYIPHMDSDPFEGSCDMARYALALWYYAPQQFRQYDEWMFAQSQPSGWHPRSVADARACAQELLQKDSVSLDDVEGDMRIRDAIALHTEILGRTSGNGDGGIPRMIFGQNWITPEADDADALLADIMSQLIVR